MVKVLSAFLVLAALAFAVDVNGRWKGDAVIEGQASPVYLSLIQQGNTLTGTGGPSPKDPDVIQNGKVEGNRVTFDVIPGGRLPLHFELSRDGDVLKGTVKVMRNGRGVVGQVVLKRRTV